MSKVTYLIGAGASRKALPLVKEIPSVLGHLRDLISNNRIHKSFNIENINGDIRWDKMEDEMIRECNDLIEKTKAHASIDTYAKKLFITERADKLKYKILKTLLSLSFIYHQMRMRTDPRYDTFFASIVGNSFNEFNGDIKIVSWNYDYQFEKAYCEYSQKTSLKENQEILQVYSPIDPFKTFDNKFSIFKINGTTAFTDASNTRTFSVFDDLTEGWNNKFAETMVWHYAASIHAENKLYPLLSFAWEPPMQSNYPIIDSSCQSIKGSSALVIIGYSFPFFNRQVDRKIFGALFQEPNLKIYVQDLNPDQIIATLPSVFPKGEKREIIPIKVDEKKDDPGQFYLPHEL